MKNYNIETILKNADAIFREEIANAGLHRNINQYFAVLTNQPFQ